MTLSYALRLLSISLASFFLVHLALSILLTLSASQAIRLAGKLNPKRAGSLLFALRLLPTAISCAVVLCVCIPSYLWLERPASRESVGLPCLALALLGAAICIFPLARVGKVLRDSNRFSKACAENAREIQTQSESFPVWMVPQESPLLAVSGMFKQRVFVSASVLRTLSHDELLAALCHERAHRIWRDNLKRLLFLLTPRGVPFSPAPRQLERAWSKFNEWAADDLAVAGDARRAVSLASALVRVARLGSSTPHPIFISSLTDGCALSERVERLLCAAPCAEESGNAQVSLLFGPVLALAAFFAAYSFGPACLLAAHEVLERLIS